MDEVVFKEVLGVCRVFLLCRGFDSSRVVDGVEDGHWLLRVIEEVGTSECPACYSAYLKNLLARLENGSYLTGEPQAPGEGEWTKSDTQKVRQIMAGAA